MPPMRVEPASATSATFPSVAGGSILLSYRYGGPAKTEYKRPSVAGGSILLSYGGTRHAGLAERTWFTQNF
jgi:hypothetical protein